MLHSLLKIVLTLSISPLIRFVHGSINPVEIHEQHFFDSVTREPFFIKGVDYQPGGSSDVTSKQDPLSDPKICARDIFLFQKLGINTIRVYSISPDLNHDACMTMMAAAGIYLILDVNSPMENQHLNRYEPWTSYNHNYLQHIFEVIEEFGHYNNTLGFFAGNEIINDGHSAKRSPSYIRAVVGDMKSYIKKNSPRGIPVGYSAADDLRYRIPLSQYLECHRENEPDSSIDFYGVNSYQWCGQQTFQTSGYDQLVSAYKEYTKPVFFSEFGCNTISPRSFAEVEALYSTDMINTFSGGLVYEFTQEPNNYGLVAMDRDGTAHLLHDFVALQNRYTAIESNEFQMIRKNAISLMAAAPLPACKDKYENIQIDEQVPQDLAKDLVRKGVDQKRGKYLSLKDSDLVSEFDIYDENGVKLNGKCKMEVVNKIEILQSDDEHVSQPKESNPDPREPPRQAEKQKEKESNAASFLTLSVPSAFFWTTCFLYFALHCNAF
ncbi:LANO_0E04940g1_1 [Lachancea nothofagi CBS 11611]|uniref:1,3-beta-glucanosyltransferase n=1 Tax=Lachancea nothofagi CBS 11611 TaxID=1266666 RepID=A0A1G4JSK4_9SACH|nr:LANO_0E04940g1_1 [Lachancea nothofagi CBS 11611]